MGLQSINPATDEVIREYDEMSQEAVENAVRRCNEAFLVWRRTTFNKRAALMKKVARVLRSNTAEYARLMALEMGKPVSAGKTEVGKCAWACEYYAENAERFLAHEIIRTEASRSLVTFQPLGVLLSIMPWNFPFWQVFRFAAPALMAGNTVVLKHAANVPGCALAIEKLFREAGLRQNIFKTLLISSDGVGAIIENPSVKAITFTGSTEAGRAVAAKAGAMLKKTVLELGGSDAYLVLEDADLEQAVELCVTSRLTNSGQSCIAAKRFVVVGSLSMRFEQLVVERMKVEKMGDPLHEDTTIGPLARHDLRDNLHRQVLESIEKGARCLLGGTIAAGKGAFYPPTVLTGVNKGMPAYDEEIFGPVAAIITVSDEAEAVTVANDSKFGLGAAVFTRDIKKGERIAVNEIEAGSCFVNTPVKSDPRLPFGGVKGSGYGRELSHYGIKEFVNIKTILCK